MLLGDTAEKEFNKEKYDFLRTENHSLLFQFKIRDSDFFVRRSFNSDDIEFGSDIDNLTTYEKSEVSALLSNLYFPVENNDVYIPGTDLEL